MVKILITVGDISSDVYAARLMRQLKLLKKDIEFIGIGGNSMINEGLHSLAPLKDISIVGFIEVIKNYNFIKSIFDKCKSIIDSGEISLFIPVDYPGFNIRLAKYVKTKNIPVVYYIAPQLWAWGKNRAKKLNDSVDKLIVVLPFEEEFFKKFKIDTVFVGHPLLDNEFFKNINSNTDKKFSIPISNKEKLIAFLPGSRLQEVQRHIPLINKIAINLKSFLPDYKYGIAISELVERRYYEKTLDKSLNWELYEHSLELMLKSEVGVIKTGTSTLEAALCYLPFVMFYKTSLFNYITGKLLVNLENISLANIILNETVVDELVQYNATPSNIANNLIKLISDKMRYAAIQEKFHKLYHLLGGSGASVKAAKIINEYL